MPLNSIIGRAIELNTIMGVTRQARAVAAAVDLLLSDDEATDEARYVAAWLGRLCTMSEPALLVMR